MLLFSKTVSWVSPSWKHEPLDFYSSSHSSVLYLLSWMSTQIPWKSCWNLDCDSVGLRVCISKSPGDTDATGLWTIWILRCYGTYQFWPSTFVIYQLFLLPPFSYQWRKDPCFLLQLLQKIFSKHCKRNIVCYLYFTNSRFPTN